MRHLRFKRVRALLLSAALSVVGARACMVHAESPSAASLDARAQHERGVQAFARGRYSEAIAAFQTADRLLPDAALSFNIAKAYEALHDYDRARSFYREYLRRAPMAPDRSAVERHMGELTRELNEQPPLRVELRSQPHGANVWVDDEPVGTAPVSLLLPSGRHRASFRLAGYRSEQVSFQISPGSAPLEVRAALEPLPASHAAAQPGSPSDAFAADSGKPRTLLRDLGFTAMLASVFAGASGGITVLVISDNRAEEREDKRVALRCEPSKCRAEPSGAL